MASDGELSVGQLVRQRFEDEARLIGFLTARGTVTERLSHYFKASLPHQFDAVLYYDTTRAVEPLERTGLWERGEPPETYPSAL